jgi:hypothetical protein
VGRNTLHTETIIQIISIIFAITVIWIAYNIIEWFRGKSQLQKLFGLLSSSNAIEKEQIDFINEKFWPLLRNIIIATDKSDREIIYPVLHKDGRMMVNRIPTQEVISPPGRWGYIAPTLLTMIGIWGTFWGINIGLMNAKLAGLQTTESLLKGSERLFAGMETSFTTSIWGMGGATIVLILVVFLHAKFQLVRKQCQNILYDIFAIAAPTNYLADIHKQLSISHKIIDERLTNIHQLMVQAKFHNYQTHTREQLEKLHQLMVRAEFPNHHTHTREQLEKLHQLMVRAEFPNHHTHTREQLEKLHQLMVRAEFPNHHTHTQAQLKTLNDLMVRAEFPNHHTHTQAQLKTLNDLMVRAEFPNHHKYTREQLEQLYDLMVRAEFPNHHKYTREQLEQLYDLMVRAEFPNHHEYTREQLEQLYDLMVKAEFPNHHEYTREQLEQLNKHTESILSYVGQKLPNTDLPENIQVAISELTAQFDDMLDRRLTKSQPKSYS